MSHDFDNELKQMAEVRATAQHEILKSVIVAGRFTRYDWGILGAIILAVIYSTVWFVNINSQTEENHRHIKVLWIDRYGIEP